MAGEQDAAAAVRAKLKKVDYIQHVMDASDYFEVLMIKSPYANEIGDPAWDVDDDSLRKAKKNMSRKTHPDKNRGRDNAKDAFEKVTQAYQCLTDPDRRLQYIKDFVEELKKNAPKEWVPASSTTGAALQKEVEVHKRKAELRKQKVAQFRTSVGDKMASKLKERLARQKKKRSQPEPEPELSSDSSDSSSSDSEDTIRAKKRQALRKKQRRARGF